MITLDKVVANEVPYLLTLVTATKYLQVWQIAIQFPTCSRQEVLCVRIRVALYGHLPVLPSLEGMNSRCAKSTIRRCASIVRLV